MTDIECTWTPSFIIVRPVSPDGEDWMHSNDFSGWLNGSLPVDHRYIADIVLGARADGLTVETTN